MREGDLKELLISIEENKGGRYLFEFLTRVIPLIVLEHLEHTKEGHKRRGNNSLPSKYKSSKSSFCFH